jgi:hypothetical protein
MFNVNPMSRLKNSNFGVAVTIHGKFYSTQPIYNVGDGTGVRTDTYDLSIMCPFIFLYR